MSGPLSSTRPEACPSDLSLDTHLARELEPSAEARLLAHLPGCERCSARLAHFREQQRAFLESAISRDFAGGLTQAPKSEPVASKRALGRASQETRRKLLPVAALSAALALALVMFTRSSDERFETRTKGSQRIGFVKHGERVRSGYSGEQVFAGDLVRFTYASDSPGYLAVLSFDGAGQASVYLDSSAIAAGSNRPLPSSVELDASLGPEKVYGVFCPEPIEAERLAKLLQAQAGAMSAPAGCSLDVLTLLKVKAE